MTKQEWFTLTEEEWHEVLIRRGFTLLESSIKMYGNRFFCGRIIKVTKDKEKKLSSFDQLYTKGVDVFSVSVPERMSTGIYPAVKLHDEPELVDFIDTFKSNISDEEFWSTVQTKPITEWI